MPAGRPPKPDGQKVTRHPLTMPGWVDLPAHNPAKPPRMPTAPRGGWSPGTRAAWQAWWADPASTQWGPADIAAVRDLAHLHQAVEDGKTSIASEVRLRMDDLGLSQKGKRNLRWRVTTVDEVAAKRDEQKASPYAHLRVAE